MLQYSPKVLYILQSMCYVCLFIIFFWSPHHNDDKDEKKNELY